MRLDLERAGRGNSSSSRVKYVMPSLQVFSTCSTKDSRARNYLGKLCLVNRQPNEARRIFESMVQAGGDE